MRVKKYIKSNKTKKCKEYYYRLMTKDGDEVLSNGEEENKNINEKELE